MQDGTKKKGRVTVKLAVRRAERFTAQRPQKTLKVYISDLLDNIYHLQTEDNAFIQGLGHSTRRIRLEDNHNRYPTKTAGASASHILVLF